MMLAPVQITDEVREQYQETILHMASKLSSVPMRYGRDDCLLFVANIDRDVIGIDPAAGYRGKYRSKRGAARVLGKGGVEGFARMIAARYGWKEIDPRAARPGDRGLVPTVEGPAGVIFSGQYWFGRADVGITAYRTIWGAKLMIPIAWSL